MIVRRDWGYVSIELADDGSTQVVLENSQLHILVQLLELNSPERYETGIRKFIIKKINEDQVQLPGGDQDGRMDIAAWRGSIAKACFVSEKEDEITVRMEWAPIKEPATIQNYTLIKDKPYLMVDYLDWFVNIVDLCTPGGVRNGMFKIYGEENWMREHVYHEEAYFSKAPDNIGYLNTTSVEDPGSLAYKGHLIMGVFNPANGHGFGRVAPVEGTDIIKLLFKDQKRGFELFPYFFKRPERKPFTGYIYAVTEGAVEVIALGKQIVDEHLKQAS